MSSLTDRLRGVIRPRVGSGGPSGPSGPEGRPDYHDVADVLGGQWCDTQGGRFLVVDRTYTPGYRHGRTALADCLPPPETGAWPRLNLLARGANIAGGANLHGSPHAERRLLFLDLETTGLAGGAGTYVFLVGCGWFEGGVFHTRQLFLSSFGAERALLESLAELAGDTSCVVTYNGRTFDLPVIETRFVLQRLRTPFDDLPHVDMLHPARRLWREEDVECRLTSLERSLCGHAREGDVPGFEIPSRYFHYVRSGDARGLEVVLEHNRLDIISLAMFTARAAQLLGDGPAAATTSREALGMGRLYERGGLVGEALESFRRAIQMGDVTATRLEALRAHAVLCRRMRRYDEAADSWRQVLELRECSTVMAREATEALAIHLEHRARNLEAARSFALHALHLQGTVPRRQAVQHRLERLDRKMRTQPADRESGQALFPIGS